MDEFSQLTVAGCSGNGLDLQKYFSEHYDSDLRRYFHLRPSI